MTHPLLARSPNHRKFSEPHSRLPEFVVKSVFKSRSGISLVSVLVGSGAAAVLALLIGQLMTQQARVQKTVFSSQDVASRHEQLKMLLSNTDVCTRNFSNQLIDKVYNQPQTRAPLSTGLQIREPGPSGALGSVVAEANLALGGGSGRIVSLAIVLTGMTPGATATQSQLYGQLRVSFELPDAAIGARSLMRSIPLRFLANDSGGNTVIQSCSAQGELRMSCNSQFTSIGNQTNSSTKHYCPGGASSQAVMVACNALLVPAGTHQCGSLVHAATSNEGPFCQVSTCTQASALGSGQSWGVTVTCCDSGGYIAPTPTLGIAETLANSTCTKRIAEYSTSGACGFNSSVSCQSDEIAISGGMDNASNVALQNSQPQFNIQNRPTGWSVSALAADNCALFNSSFYPNSVSQNSNANCFTGTAGTFCGRAFALCCK